MRFIIMIYFRIDRIYLKFILFKRLLATLNVTYLGKTLNIHQVVRSIRYSTMPRFNLKHVKLDRHTNYGKERFASQTEIRFMVVCCLAFLLMTTAFYIMKADDLQAFLNSSNFSQDEIPPVPIAIK